MYVTFLSLLAFAGIGLSSYGLGRPLVRWLHVDRDDRLAVTVWSLALGLLAAGLGLTLWGVLGGLSAAAIRVLTVFAAAAGLAYVGWDKAFSAGWHAQSAAMGVILQRKHAVRCAQGRATPSQGLFVGLFTLAGLAVSAALVSALAPAVAGDALCYHLELPKVFLAQGRLLYLPYHDNATFPLLTETWYLWALALDSAVTAQLVHWGLGVLLGLSAVLLATPMLGRSWAWLVGCVVVLVPGVTNQMSAPLNDVALAVFTTLALVAWQEGFRVQGSGFRVQDSAVGWLAAEPKRRPSLLAQRSFLLAGLMAGAALSIKYVALLFAAAVGVTWCWAMLREGRRRHKPEAHGRVDSGRSHACASGIFRAGLLVTIVAVGVSGIWYARAACYRGNPIYPFFAEEFGDHGPATLRDSKTPLKWTVANLVTSPWQVTMRPERFGGRGHQLGALFLVTLPALCVVRRHRLLHTSPNRKRGQIFRQPRWRVGLVCDGGRSGLGSLLAVAGVYWLLWYGLRQNMRFLFPLLPLLAVAAVSVWIDLRRWPRAPGLVAAGVCGTLVVLMALIPLARSRRHLPVALGLESREHFLTHHEPTYQATVFVNANLPREARILSQEQRAFYFDREMTRENIFRRSTSYTDRLVEPGDLVPLLREAGFTHLLLAESDGPGIRYNRTLTDWANATLDLEETPLTVLLAYEFDDPDGTWRRYRLLELAAP